MFYLSDLDIQTMCKELKIGACTCSTHNGVQSKASYCKQLPKTEIMTWGFCCSGSVIWGITRVCDFTWHGCFCSIRVPMHTHRTSQEAPPLHPIPSCCFGESKDSTVFHPLICFLYDSMLKIFYLRNILAGRLLYSSFVIQRSRTAH